MPIRKRARSLRVTGHKQRLAKKHLGMASKTGIATSLQMFDPAPDATASRNVPPDKVIIDFQRIEKLYVFTARGLDDLYVAKHDLDAALARLPAALQASVHYNYKVKRHYRTQGMTQRSRSLIEKENNRSLEGVLEFHSQG
ncbi:MAG: hypothetical protein ACPGOV_17105 [Magnetovibrionaceae bacterium]